MDDLQKSLKKSLKKYDFEKPYVLQLASSVYSDQVVDWNVEWLRTCSYKGQPLNADRSLVAGVWFIRVSPVWE